MLSSVFLLLIGNYSITRYYRRSEGKLGEVTPVKLQVKKSVAKVGHRVCQRKIQGQKREIASASVERGKDDSMGHWGGKGCSTGRLKEARTEWKAKTGSILIRHASETLKLPVCSGVDSFLGWGLYCDHCWAFLGCLGRRLTLRSSNAVVSSLRFVAVWSLFCFEHTGKM